jgi:hypothetical protein
MTADIDRYRTNLLDELNGVRFGRGELCVERGVGMVTSLFSGRGLWYSASRQLVFGCVAAGATYGIGVLLGASLS